METDTILAGIARIVGDVTGADPAQVRPTTSFVDDLGVDSLSMVEIILSCEEAFDVQIPDDAFSAIATVGDAITAVAMTGH
jgi:acyl carrier protein